MTPSGIVTLLSDFGTRDGYVGALKGVILARFPAARVVDLAHELAPGDVAAASAVLGQSAPLFPQGTVHLAIVDPGVGTGRRGLAVGVGGQLYVGPDNGIFSAVLHSTGPVVAHALEKRRLWREPVSPVFHGRDVFAPVAAHLASGGALADVGPALIPESLQRLPAREPVAEPDGLRGEVVQVDRFGNLITNLRPPGLEQASAATVLVAGRELALVVTYGNVAPGELLAVVGSSGRIEIAVNGGSAAAALSSSVGSVVVLRAPRESA
jgi:S-adenosylmethionine hydrolase